jgi:hypothetical protein
MSRIVKAAVLTAAAGAAVAGASGIAVADSGAQGSAENSPGIASGNVATVPMHLPFNLCGNTADVIGLLNPASGVTCAIS